MMAVPLSDVEKIDHFGSELHVDTGIERCSQFSSPSDCLTPTTTFTSYASSGSDYGESRRTSVSGSEFSFKAPTHNTSLRTSLSPVNPFPMAMVEASMRDEPYIVHMPSEFAAPSIFGYDDETDSTGDLQLMFQVAVTCGPHDQAIELDDSAHQPFRQYLPETVASLDRPLRAGANLQSSLSQPIFHRQSKGPMTPLVTSWTNSALQTPPRTVAPNATLQGMLSPSPASHAVSSDHHESGEEELVATTAKSTAQLSSPLYSSAEVSWAGENELGVREIQPTMVRTMRRSAVAGVSVGRRRSREGRQRNSVRRRSSQVMTHSGIRVPDIAEKPAHGCTFDGCVDKDGRRRRFERFEHLKRHEKTCHGGLRPYACWVPGCQTKAFSRTDNLNSHLHKTHGKNSPAARNRYIATLDATSPYFQPNYRGPFTELGYPVRTAKL